MANIDYGVCQTKTISDVSPDWQKEVSNIERGSKTQQTTRFTKKIVGDAHRSKFVEVEKPKQSFVTGTSYTGRWNIIGMNGDGLCSFIHEVEYEGNLRDGMFHEDGKMTYPMGQKLEGEWFKGRLMTFKYIFADGLEHDIPWKYCVMPDRRFYTSIQDGLRPAGRSLLTNQEPPREIPEGCYDTGDGFYNPATKCVMSAIKPNKIIRIPTATEEKWIMKNCRKAWDETSGYRPDLYEHWATGRKTDSVFNEINAEEDVNNSTSSSSDNWLASQTSVKIIVSPDSEASPLSSLNGNYSWRHTPMTNASST